MLEDLTWTKIISLAIFNGLIAALCVAFIPYRTSLGLVSIQIIVMSACFLSVWFVRRVNL
jgi:hypothetical protein